MLYDKLGKVKRFHSGLIKTMTSADGKSNIKQQIAENLNRVYQEALEDDVPDAFAEMIERFKAEKAKLDKAKTDDK